VGLTVGVGVAVAAAAWAFLFIPPLDRFWKRAAIAGPVIGLYALVAQRGRLGDVLGPSAVEVVLGVAAAAVLYGVFWAGDRVLGRVAPALSAQVTDLYRVRAGAAAGVLVVVGLCEELFWRGFVQDRAGFALALAGYAAVHVWERKPVLVLAAVVGGAYWGALFLWRDSLTASLVSHALWDLAIVVWFPLRRR